MATDGAVVLPLIASESEVGGGYVTLPSLRTITDGAAVTLPIFEVGGQHFVANGTVELPLFSTSGYYVGGEIGTGAITLFAMDASGRGGRAGYAGIELPLIEVASTGGPLATITASLILPMLEPLGAVYNPPSSGAPTADTGSAYDVFVVNSRTKAHSKYNNYRFNSFGNFNDNMYACGSDGIYQLTGSEDDGNNITTSLIWAISNMGSTRVKWVDAAYLHIRGDTGNLEVWSTVDERTRRIYTVDLNQSPQGMHVRRALFGRGLFGTWFSIGVKKETSEPLTVSDIELRVVNRQRRLR